MARNGSGTYTKVNTFVASQPITASGHNQNWDDIATEITNSVAADGQTTMTGALKAASGTVSVPGIGFASDPNTGIYRIGSDNLGIAANGAKVVDVATTGVTVTGDLNATTVKQAGFSLLPVGLGPLPWSGTAAPSGWVLCYGQTLLRASYPALWAFAEAEIALSNTLFTNGNGTTNFTVPDMRGRGTAGQDDMGGVAASRLTDAVSGFGDGLGEAGGGQSTTLITANLPAYTPSGTNAGGAASFTHSAASFQPGSTIVDGTDIQTTGGGTTIAMSTANSNFTQPTFTGVAQGGTSTAFSNMPPTIVTNYIIFAGV